MKLGFLYKIKGFFKNCLEYGDISYRRAAPSTLQSVFYTVLHFITNDIFHHRSLKKKKKKHLTKFNKASKLSHISSLS